MRNTIDSGPFTPTDRRNALSACYPEPTYGAVPVQDRYDALEAEPQALAANVDFHQYQ